jgi:plastocyanin
MNQTGAGGNTTGTGVVPGEIAEPRDNETSSGNATSGNTTSGNATSGGNNNNVTSNETGNQTGGTSGNSTSSSPSSSGGGTDVSITPGASTKTTNAFDPGTIELSEGDTVTWTNNDSTIHTATSGDPSGGATGMFGGSAASPSLIAPGTTQSFTFDEEGEYPYYCVLHPTMTGTVSVS